MPLISPRPVHKIIHEPSEECRSGIGMVPRVEEASRTGDCKSLDILCGLGDSQIYMIQVATVGLQELPRQEKLYSESAFPATPDSLFPSRANLQVHYGGSGL